MSRDDYREVDFSTYCKKCEQYETKEYEDPCNECLECSYNYNTSKPINFKEKEK